jgi:peptidoglycan/LPS O-acetylase OafA/YrhL
MHAPPVQPHVRTVYRPDIDGLRAVAVLSVLYFHYGEPLPQQWRLPGGFTGVDVFFVISGFLITSRLWDDIEAGTFSILGFYDRRIRRILPALIVMLAVTLLAGKFLLMPGDYNALATSTAAAAFGVSNFFFLAKTGYFDQSADLMPLLHTWSLAVEEQFYVVWPVLLFVIGRERARLQIAGILGAIVLLGFAASLLWFDAKPKAAFFMAAPRAWELAIGALLVFLPSLSRRSGEAATVFGVALIGAGFVLVKASSFPGPAALYPCLGAALVIWPRSEPTRGGAALGLLRPIGLISYSLYLWHWPIWVMFRIFINNGQPRIQEALAVAAVSIVIAALSYRIVEQPFRKRRWRPSQSVWAGLVTCTLIFCGAKYVNSAEGLPGRISKDAYAMRSLDAMWEWPCKRIDLSREIRNACVFGAPWADGIEKAVLWGDSNADMLAPFLDVIAKQANVAVALHLNCPAVLNGETVLRNTDIVPGYNTDCGQSRLALLALLANRPDIKTVVLSASWAYLIGVLVGKQSLSAEQNHAKLFQISLDDTVSRLTALGKRVVMISTIPQWFKDPVPCHMVNVGLLRRQCGDDERYLLKSTNDRFQSESVAVFLRVAESHPEATLIIPGKGLCPSARCIDTVNGEAIYRDVVHLRRNLSEATNRELAHLIGLDRVFLRSGIGGHP